MAEISQIAKTPIEKRKTSHDQFIIEFLKALPLFQNKSRDELLLLSWLFQYTLVGLKSLLEVEPNSVIIVIEGEINVSCSKKGAWKVAHHFHLQPKRIYVTSLHQTFTANKDSQLLVLKASDYEYCLKYADKSFRQEEDFIKKCKFSHQMSQEDIKRVQSRGRFQSFHIGQTVYSKGNEVKGFYIVRKGSFVLKKSLLIANLFYKKINVSQVFEGQVIGYGEIIDNVEFRQSDLVCNSAEGQLIYIRKQNFSLLKSNLLSIHGQRKAINQILQKKKLETLSNVLPFISSPANNQSKLFRVKTSQKLTRFITHSFNDIETEQEQTCFQNSYSNKKIKEHKKTISNIKPKFKPAFFNPKNPPQSVNCNTICETLTNQSIHKKHDKFQKFRKQKSISKTYEVDTPFKQLARSFRYTYQQQKLKQICEGGCKRNCRKRYL